MSIGKTFKVSFAAVVLFGSGCSDRSSESNERLKIWRAMVIQAEQMRTDELQTDIRLLDSLQEAGDSEKFEHERENICRKWSKVERLSPVPVDLDYVPELMPVPAELPCSGLEVGEHGESIKLRRFG